MCAERKVRHSGAISALRCYSTKLQGAGWSAKSLRVPQVEGGDGISEPEPFPIYSPGYGHAGMKGWLTIGAICTGSSQLMDNS